MRAVCEQGGCQQRRPKNSCSCYTQLPERRLAISYAPALEWNGMPATDQASADPCLDRRFGFGCVALWESFAAGGATKGATSWRHPIHRQTAMQCIGRGHIAGCNNPPSGPSPMASRPGLLTNTPIHASSTILGPKLFLKGEI